MPDYHLLDSNRRKKALQKEANKHSVSIELEGYDTSSTHGRREKSAEQNRSIRQLTTAFELGLQNYTGELDEDFIRGIGMKIDPISNEKGYRTEKVRVSGAIWSPPSPEKLDRELSVFLFENKCLDNVLEQSLHAHFHIARIHPFLDGNGRTARLVQNIMYNKLDFPLQ